MLCRMSTGKGKVMAETNRHFSPRVTLAAISLKIGPINLLAPIKGPLSVSRILLAKCVKNARDHINRDAALEMEAGPPKPACRSMLQTTISCVGQKPGW